MRKENGDGPGKEESMPHERGLFINGMEIVVVVGDITRLKVGAIVNAANGTLLGGGGVDGAIHKAAGPQLKEECRKLGGCETGQAKITHAYNLPAQYVIHTVGPIYDRHTPEEAAELLTACYQNSLGVACANNVETIAFSAISTGVYGYPPEDAAQIVLSSIESFSYEGTNPIRQIALVGYPGDSYGMNTLRAYQNTFSSAEFIYTG